MENEIKIDQLIHDSSIIVNDTYSYANNSLFYSLVNPSYYDYYYRIVRQCAMWLDGYVHDFHNGKNGIFSTRLATALVYGLRSQLTGKTIMFKKHSGATEDKTLDFISHTWSKETNFVNTIKTAMGYELGLGTSVIKLNKSRGKRVWVEAVRLDYCYFDTDFQGNITDLTCFIKKYTDTNATKDNSTNKNYFLVEHRFYKTIEKKCQHTINGQVVSFVKKEVMPVVEYKVHCFVGLSLQPTMAQQKDKMGIEWLDLPRNIRRKIKDDYGTIKVNEPKLMPFEDLGADLLKFGCEDITLPTGQFGVSVLANIISELMAYDLAWSWTIRDMYNGKGMVAIPKTLSQADINGVRSALSGLEINKYEQIPSANPEKDRPFNYQFELRGAEWSAIQDNILRKIATKVGLSARVLASYLDNDGASKTATEMEQDSDSVCAWVEEHRQDIEPSINKMLNRITHFYGLVGEVEVSFATPSLVNKDLVLERAIKKYTMGLQDLKDTLKEIYPDLDDKQIDEKVKRAKERQKEIVNQQDIFNNLDNESE